MVETGISNRDYYKMKIDIDQFNESLGALKNRLLLERGGDSYWTGELSSSALSTATAVCAIAVYDKEQSRELVIGGLDWLSANVNVDDGWGDTIVSFSNLPTTLLCWSAFAFSPERGKYAEVVAKAEAWIVERIGSLEPAAIAKAVEEQYGKDRTFSVPILTMCAIAGRLGEAGDCWTHVSELPFELAVFPHFMFKMLRLSVVSYALPALIAIGMVRFNSLRPANPFLRVVRSLSRKRVLKRLERIQPANGGFLEATPLTSFVSMSLVAAGLRENPVAGKAVGFLAESVRADGSWLIDTDLATWVTTLSVNALGAGEDYDSDLTAGQREAIVEWLLGQQYTETHPYTNSPAGGWAWTDKMGAVPDADDTAGAVLALSKLKGDGDRVLAAVTNGIKWLMSLQNRDGGIATFCAGWTKLPFDCSAPDLSAHAIAAITAWQGRLDEQFAAKATNAVVRMIDYLRDVQREDGAWVPLWFGNQHTGAQDNPVYGTAKVLSCVGGIDACSELMSKATDYLVGCQNENGSWGGDVGCVSSVEETSLAVDALCTVCLGDRSRMSSEIEDAIVKGCRWICGQISEDGSVNPSPIGLYFASLWYYEKLYPVAFAVSALNKALRCLK